MPDINVDTSNLSDSSLPDQSQPDQSAQNTTSNTQNSPQQPQNNPNPQAGSNQAPSASPQGTTPSLQATVPPSAGSQAGSVASNRPTTPQQPLPSQHPAVQKAGLLNQVAEALAGGPRYQVSIDQDGTSKRTPLPVSNAHIGMAIALEAISGALTGLSQQGPNAAARGASAAFTQSQQRVQQQQLNQEQQAQSDFNNKQTALAQKASIAHINAQTIAAVSEAEQRGAESIDALARINRESGVLDLSPEMLDNNGEGMTQAEMLAAMQSGNLNITDKMGPVSGRTEVTAKDGSKRWESLHLILKDPNANMPLTPEMFARYKAAGVPGFQSNVPAFTATAPLRMIQGFNETAASHYLAEQRLSDLRDTLKGTPQADHVPASIDFNQPGVATALSRFRYYTSHNADNLGDVYLALQEMGKGKRDGQGNMVPNADAKYVDTVAQTFGGWPVLEGLHNQILANTKSTEQFAVIDSLDKANAVMASPRKFTQDQVSAARGFVSLSNQQGAMKTSEEARARAVATGADQEAMYKWGINPITKERLTIENAPSEMLVDTHGQPVPQNQQALFKPTAQEKQTADTARQVLALSNELAAAVKKNPALIGPLAGNSKEGLAKLGIGNAESQQLLDSISFIQTATTKMHTGRFSSQILDKMGNLIKPGMNDQQFQGALASINGVATRYADEDKLITVADYKAGQNATQQQANSQANTNANHTTPSHIIPKGAIVGRDAKGNIAGYKLGNQEVRF